MRTPDKNRPITFCVLTDFLESDYHVNVLNGILDFTAENGINLLCFDVGNLASPDSVERGRNILFDIAGWNPGNGIIIASSLIGQYTGPERLRELCRERFKGVPVVTVSEWLKDWPVVLNDAEQGMNDLILHMIRHHGYRRFAIIKGPRGTAAAEEKFDLCITLLKRHNIGINSRYIIETCYGVQAGFQAIEELIDVRKLSFDAVFASNDDTALGAIRALEMRGIAVPDKVAVVGVDNSPAGDFSSPRLTTVNWPNYELGQAAAQTLYDIITGNDPGPVIKALPTRLVIRESCGCSELPRSEAETSGINKRKETLDHLFSAQRSILLDRMIGTVNESYPGKKSVLTEKADTIVNSLQESLEKRDPAVFLKAWEETLPFLLNEGYTDPLLNSLLQTLRNHVIPRIGDCDKLLMADNLFFKAMETTGLKASGARFSRYLLDTNRDRNLDSFFAMLDNTRDLAQQLSIMDNRIPSLGIDDFFLVLYETNKPETDTGCASLFIGIHDNRRAAVDREGIKLPIRDIIGKGILPGLTDYKLAVQALFWGEDHIGFILMDVKNFADYPFSSLRNRLSMSLRNTLLLDRIRNLTGNMEKIMKEKDKDIANAVMAMQNEVKKLQDILTGGRDEDFTGSYDDFRIQKAVSYIQENYQREITLEAVAKKLFLRPDYFSHFFKLKTGTGFLEYLTSFRLEKALKLLENPQLSIKEIASMVGYRDPNYFGKIIKKQTGLMPTEYRKQVLSGKTKPQTP